MSDSPPASPGPRPVGDDLPRAALLMVAGSALFVAIAAIVKLVADEVAPMQAVLYRSFVSALPILWVVRRRRIPALGGRRRLLLVRGLFGFLALSTYFWAIVHIPLADVQALQQTSPVFTTILAVLLLGERPFARHYVLVGVCLAGALLVIRPTRGLVSLPAAVALLSAACSAGAYTTIRALTRTEPLPRIVLWFAGTATVLALPFALPGWRWPSLDATLLLVAAGLLAAPGQALLTASYRYAPAHIAAAFSYANVPLATLAGALVWGERPGATVGLGIALVVGGGVLLTLLSRSEPAG